MNCCYFLSWVQGSVWGAFILGGLILYPTLYVKAKQELRSEYSSLLLSTNAHFALNEFEYEPIKDDVSITHDDLKLTVRDVRERELFEMQNREIKKYKAGSKKRKIKENMSEIKEEEIATEIRIVDDSDITDDIQADDENEIVHNIQGKYRGDNPYEPLKASTLSHYYYYSLPSYCDPSLDGFDNVRADNEHAEDRGIQKIKGKNYIMFIRADQEKDGTHKWSPVITYGDKKIKYHGTYHLDQRRLQSYFKIVSETHIPIVTKLKDAHLAIYWLCAYWNAADLSSGFAQIHDYNSDGLIIKVVIDRRVTKEFTRYVQLSMLTGIAVQQMRSE